MKHDSDYSTPKKYPHKASNTSGKSAGSSKVTTHHTTADNPNDGMKPNAGKGPKYKYTSY